MDLNQSLAQATIAAAVGELRAAQSRIRHCVDQLTDEQIWLRPNPSMNSIGNLLLHLGGNLTQWVIHGLTDAADTRDRPAEFAERGPIPKADLTSRLDGIVDQACAVLECQTSESLLAQRVIQGFDVNSLQAIFDSVPHFRGHTQEIIHMTRAMLGDAYQFDWAPTTSEQGAPAPAA